MKKWLFLLMLPFSTPAFAEMRANVPASVKQGGYFIVRIADDDPSAENHLVRFGGGKKAVRVFSFKSENGVFLALIPVSASFPAGKQEIVVRSNAPAVKRVFAEIKVEKVNFPESKRVFYVKKPSAAMRARREREQNFLRAIYRRVTAKKYFSENFRFANPLEKTEVVPNSDFGQIRKKALINPKTRKIESRWKDYHKGVDFRAPIGTPVFAAEDGVVVAARNLLGSGNTIIIDHGYGLLSLYFHLSKIQVEEGKLIKQGQKIGLSGKSGNAEGPHLHFEIRMHEIPVNPHEFLGGAK